MVPVMANTILNHPTTRFPSWYPYYANCDSFWFGKLQGFFLPMKSNRIERVMFLLLLLFFSMS